MEIARSFGDAFARAGVEVVSGGARGIDTAGHEGALWGEGRSVAVLGCGIDVPYPVENQHLFDRHQRFFRRAGRDLLARENLGRAAGKHQDAFGAAELDSGRDLGDLLQHLYQSLGELLVLVQRKSRLRVGEEQVDVAARFARRAVDGYLPRSSPGVRHE